MTDPQVKVTLVHGTFASKAEWIRKGQMTEALEAAGIAHEPFVWSGGNSHRARTKAARELADHLERERLPGVRQAVVAHSHGGNIAVHAVWRHGKVEDGSIPVVTLATPFLFASRKSFRPEVWITAVLVALAALVLGPVLTLTEGLPRRGDDRLWMVVLLDVMWVVVVIQLLACVYWLTRHGRPWRKENRDQFITAVQTPDADSGGLLVVRAADDEASTSLSLAQLSTLVAVTAMRMSRPQIWGTVFSTVAFTGLVLDVLPFWDIADLWTLVLAIGVTLACIFSLGVVSVPALFGFLLGPDGPTANLFAVVSAEATPPGRHEVIQRPMRHLSVEGLAHSSLYDDKDVIAWVVDHVRTDPRQSPPQSQMR